MEHPSVQTVVRSPRRLFSDSERALTAAGLKYLREYRRMKAATRTMPYHRKLA